MNLYRTFVFLLTCSSAVSYNVLMMIAVGSRSHKVALDPIAEALARKGHQVTFISPIRGSKDSPGVHNVLLAKNADFIDVWNYNFFNGSQMGFQFYKKIFGPLVDVCQLTYHEEPEVITLIKNPRDHKYDVFIMDGILNDFLLAIGHHLRVPTIVVSPAQKMPPMAWAMNIPSPHAYVPLGMEFVVGPRTFAQRFKDTLMQLIFMYVSDYFYFQACEEIIGKVIPDLPPLWSLQEKISFLMTNSHPSVHHSVPGMPYFAEVGCLHCKKANPLPKELEDYMTSSGDQGVIYFSLGSVQQGSAMPMELRDKIIQAFAQLPQKILWKYEVEIDNLPKNIKIIKWAPQQDILAHNKTRLFITHGGGMSSLEAAYHGCPLLGFPLSGEQWGNIANAVNKGYAEALEWQTLTTEELHRTIKLILENARYQISATQVSSFLRDRPQDPVETAVYWIEYVIRHKGARHLKSAADHLNTYQYLLLDVIAFLIAVVSIVLLTSYFLLRMCYRIAFKSKIGKLKSN